ncbi:phage integrase central domain-containing protein, partial [Mycobacterium tuberculosis]
AKRVLLEGRDPALVKQLTKADWSAAADNTFQVVADRWFEKKSGWVLAKYDEWREAYGAARVRDAANWTKPGTRGWSAVHSDDVLKSLRRDAYPVIGALPMVDIDTPKILE